MELTQTALPEQEIALLNDLARKWKGKQGNLIMILHEIQNHYGYIPRPVAMNLSNVIDVPLARIYEVITFYNYFKLKPPGKFNIAVCMGTARTGSWVLAAAKPASRN